MNFVAIDVETANSDFASICQVGVAAFRDGMLHDTWESLVDPEDYFDAMNVSVHGIDERAVRGAPKWQTIHEFLGPWLQDHVVASHTPFDRAALFRACDKIGLPPHNCTWLDTARVVRRAWPAFAKKGYGLANVTKHLKIQFQHHNAKEDARAAGEVLIRAMAETGLTVEQWLDRTAKPINLLSAAPVSRRGNLVVGDQDIARLSGHERSSKHRKAEELMAQGQAIRIIGESDCRRLLALHT